jgi:ATP-dependent DNA helicase DinG
VRARDVLGPGSPLSANLPGYEDRPGQLAMAEAVEVALAQERPLFVEAGTGTGKTLAYLVPAVLSGKKIVVSTATRALEEQIFAKDLPIVRTILAPLGIDFRAALMKGLANYVCKRRLGELLASDGAARIGSDRDLARLVEWAKETETGDRAELAALAEDAAAWRDVQSSSDTRIGAACEHYDACFVTKMRRDAEEATIVVVNHHLFFADLALRRGRGGDYASAIPPLRRRHFRRSPPDRGHRDRFFRGAGVELQDRVAGARREARVRGGAPAERARDGRGEVAPRRRHQREPALFHGARVAGESKRRGGAKDPVGA